VYLGCEAVGPRVWPAAMAGLATPRRSMTCALLLMSCLLAVSEEERVVSLEGEVEALREDVTTLQDPAASSTLDTAPNAMTSSASAANASATNGTNGTNSSVDAAVKEKIEDIKIRLDGNNTSPLTDLEKMRLEMAGCKDTPEYMEECPEKKELCTSKKYGNMVQRQCPRTCEVCKPGNDVIDVKTVCKPKPVIPELANSLMKASSSEDSDSGPDKARLDAQSTPWVPAQQQQGQWLEITLPEEMTVSGVATQGRYNDNDWVSYYKLMYKTKHWDWYSGGKWLRGNWDRKTVKKHDLKPFKAKFLRFYPKKWNQNIAMRVEVYACKEDKKVVPTADVVKKLSAGVKSVVDSNIANSTANAVKAMRSIVNTDNDAFKNMVAGVVKNATTAATLAIKNAAQKTVNEAVTQATEMATARIQHAATHAVPQAQAAIEAAVNVTQQQELAGAAVDVAVDEATDAP